MVRRPSANSKSMRPTLLKRAKSGLAAIAAFTALAGCGEGGGETGAAPPEAVTKPEDDLTDLAAVAQMLRATLAIGLGSGVASWTRVVADDRPNACAVAGTYQRLSRESDLSAALSACAVEQAPGLTLTGLMPAGATLGTGHHLQASGTLLGWSEGVTVADNAQISSSLGRTSGDVSVALVNGLARFGSGATYLVDNAILNGTIVRRGADTAYAGRFSARFDSKGRNHVASSLSPLIWEPDRGIVAGTLTASFSDASGIRNYEIAFGAEADVMIRGLGGARSASFMWHGDAFQAALRAAVSP